ncbi:hypothetical protein ACGFZR_04460 [Streptomyces sp. NPDC048241]|uniref:hypothetical protein n=1 Tax=Streptomyces sp. NPDC048241 TaxID=3365521 RepID=UPI00371460FD
MADDVVAGADAGGVAEGYGVGDGAALEFGDVLVRLVWHARLSLAGGGSLRVCGFLARGAVDCITWDLRRGLRAGHRGHR